MQAPTHILAGVAIQKAFSKMRNRTVAFILMAICAFLSHGLLDKLARMTYHPPKADFNDPVWVTYHIFVLLSSLYFFYIFWRKYKWGILFAILPDFDWVFIHGQSWTGLNIPFYKQPHIHNFVHSIFDTITPFLNDLPDYRFNPWTALFEVILVVMVYIFMRKKGVLERRSAT